MEALNSFGLSTGYDSALKLVQTVANHCINDAQVAVQDPAGWLFGYDNINMSTSIFVEQRSSAPAKVQSGTYQGYTGLMIQYTGPVGRSGR